jgi:hypothetical protein
MLPILAPALPILPAPPMPPKVPAPAVVDFKALARDLAKKLFDKKRDDVLRAVEALPVADRDRLETELIPTLSKDKLKPHGIELRRIIRFVRHKPKAVPAGPSFTDPSGGTDAKIKDSKLPNGGTVRVKTGVTVDLGKRNKSSEAYSITYDGPDVADMRWLQMIWREVVQEFVAKGKEKAHKLPVKRRLDNPSGLTLPWFLTTHPDSAKDSSKRRWNADSPSGNSPFYEEKSPVKREGTTLTMFDFPSALPTPQLASQLFKAATPPDTVTAKFHAETYLVHGMDVLYRVKIDMSWTIGKDLKTPPATVSVSGGRISEIDGPQRACLAIQHPDVDYLPGPPIGVPLPDDEFDPVGDLADADWLKHRDDLERYEDIAVLGHSELIRDVTGRGASTINKNTPAIAGLNYQASLGTEGQTGFIDSKKAYHNPDIPAARDGSLPQVAMILGSKAFGWGDRGGKPIPREKAFPLATLRHEMMHATHNDLAIGWLIKWRDDFTDLSFDAWLAQEQDAKRMSELDFTLVSSGIKPFNLPATELLAWTEGFVTAIPHLPAAPDLTLLKVKETWPAAMGELFGAGERYRVLRSETIKKAALARIRKVICSSVTPAQRTSLTNWINVMLDPATHSLTKGDKDTVTLLNAFFGSQKTWLKDVLDQVTKACPT